jgi:cell division initiation protein
MKITPLEIRQKEFEKKLRGFDKDEVNAFLLSLSNEWERVLDANKELSIKLKQAEKEVEKLREVESSLYKTLKTAEDTGANMIDQANKAAELHMKETQMNAEAMLSEAKAKARAMIERAEVEARQIIEELQDAVSSIQQNHRDIESHRQIAISELKNLSVTLIEKVERSSGENKEFKFDDYVKRVKNLARESDDRIKAEGTKVDAAFKKIVTPPVEKIVIPEPKEEPKQETAEEVVKVEKKEEQKIEVKAEPVFDRKASENKHQEKVKEEELHEEKVSKTEVIEKREPKIETPKIEAKKAVPKEEEPRKPKIARTVSFFDELDTDS